MKNISIFSLVAIALVSIAPTIAYAQYDDVPATHPYADAIEYAEQHGFLSAEDHMFHPNQLVTRAEFTQMLVNVFYDKAGQEDCYDLIGGKSPTTFTLLFTDVKTDASYGKQLCMALQTGLVSGHPDGSFRPLNTINFAEASKIATRAFRVAPYGHIALEGKPWYYAYTQTMKQLNAVPKGAENPAHLLTRGEVAEMLYLLRDVNPGPWTMPNLVPVFPAVDSSTSNGSIMKALPPQSIGNYHQRLRAPTTLP